MLNMQYNSNEINHLKKWVIHAHRELFLLNPLCLSHNSKQIYREEQEYEGKINNDEREIMHFQFVYIEHNKE